MKVCLRMWVCVSESGRKSNQLFVWITSWIPSPPTEFSEGLSWEKCGGGRGLASAHCPFTLAVTTGMVGFYGLFPRGVFCFALCPDAANGSSLGASQCPVASFSVHMPLSPLSLAPSPPRHLDTPSHGQGLSQPPVGGLGHSLKPCVTPKACVNTQTGGSAESRPCPKHMCTKHTCTADRRQTFHQHGLCSSHLFTHIGAWLLLLGDSWLSILLFGFYLLCK